MQSQQGNPGVSPAAAADLCRRQIDADRRALGVDAVDMWLVRDSPNCDVVRSQWAVLEDARRRGAVRAIGTVNFCEAQLDCLLATADVAPAVNYYMLHVGMGADLCANQIFNPDSMCAYSNVLTQTLQLCFENSTRAIDSSKNQPNRLRFDRAREF